MLQYSSLVDKYISLLLPWSPLMLIADKPIMNKNGAQPRVISPRGDAGRGATDRSHSYQALSTSFSKLTINTQRRCRPFRWRLAIISVARSRNRFVGWLIHSRLEIKTLITDRLLIVSDACCVHFWTACKYLVLCSIRSCDSRKEYIGVLWWRFSCCCCCVTKLLAFFFCVFLSYSTVRFR